MTLNKTQFDGGPRVAVPRTNSERVDHLMDHHGQSAEDLDELVLNMKGEGWSEGQAYVRRHAGMHGHLAGWEGQYTDGPPDHHHASPRGRY